MSTWTGWLTGPPPVGFQRPAVPAVRVAVGVEGGPHPIGRTVAEEMGEPGAWSITRAVSQMKCAAASWSTHRDVEAEATGLGLERIGLPGLGASFPVQTQ